MGIIRNGANGGFSGKAGSVIGSSWNNVSYIKGLPKISTKPASLKQMDQRLRFGIVMGFLVPIKDMLLKGYKGQAAGKATGFNLGVQYALNNAVAGTYPAYEIDFSLVQISRGTVQKPASIVLSSTVAGSLEVAWSPQLNTLNAFADDVLVALLYNADQKFFLSYTEAGLRADGTASLDIPADFSGQAVHAYFFYVARDDARQSVSAYSAPVTMV